jgi:hypothetical protein
VKRSEVKRSEVVYIQSRGSLDNVATSYRLDGLGSFSGSILQFSMFLLYFFSLVFYNVHVLIYMYFIVLWMFMYLY